MPDSASELELRRLALEERRIQDAREIREKEIALERDKLASENTAAQPAAKPAVRLAVISLLSAAVGAAASLGAAFFAGAFQVQSVEVQGANAVSLAQQKFSFDLISVALAEQDDQTRAARLRFMVDIGLLENLRAEKIIEYAQREEERLREGSEFLASNPLAEALVLPSYIPRIDPVILEKPVGGEKISAQVVQIPDAALELLPGHAVVLEMAGKNKISVIKEVRSITGLGLKDSKDLVETSDGIIASGLFQDEAQNIVQALEALGATVRIEIVE